MKIRLVPLKTPKAPTDPYREIVHENPTKYRRIFRKVVGEFVGVLLFVFMVGGSVVSSQYYTTNSSADLRDVVSRTMFLAFVQALSLGAIIWFTLHLGCVLNPAVCVALICSYRLGILNAIGLIIVELCGAMVGAALLKWAVPFPFERNLGATTLSPGTNVGHGILLEMMGTFFLSLVVLATAIHNERDPDISRVAPLAIGFAVFAGVSTLNPFTGGSLNPARSFGPAVIKDVWHDHYVYWIGPMLGGLIAGLFYRFIFAERVTYRYIERNDIQEEKSKVIGSLAAAVNTTEGQPTGDDAQKLNVPDIDGSARA